MPSRFLSKNTTIRRPPLTSQSPRRSPYRRLNGPGRCSPKTRGLRHDTNNTSTRPTIQRIGLPLYCSGPLRRNYNRLNLPPPNRPQIPHCLLLSQPHGLSRRRNSYPNPMRLYRSASLNNCSWTCILRPLLSSQHQLRTNP